MGAWLAGMVVVPLNTSLPPADVERLIDKAGSDCSSCRPAAAVPLPECRGWHWRSMTMAAWSACVGPMRGARQGGAMI